MSDNLKLAGDDRIMGMSSDAAGIFCAFVIIFGFAGGLTAYNSIKNYMYPEIAIKEAAEAKEKAERWAAQREAALAKRAAHVEQVKGYIQKLDPNTQLVIQEVANNPAIVREAFSTNA